MADHSLIDWEQFDAQRLAYEPRSIEAAFFDRLHQAIAELPDPTWRQIAAMWINDAYWRLREALQSVRLYP